MATPQAHGVLTILALIIFRFFGKITYWEYVFALIWGMGIDIDHFFVWSWDYWKNVCRRICNGQPETNDKHPASWLHLWPGMILVLFFGWFLARWRFGRWYLPFVFWLSHAGFDFLQKSEHAYFWYPLITKKLWEPKWGYPNKSPKESVLCCLILIVVSFVLFAFWNFS